MIVDEGGAIRHQMSQEKLSRLYRDMANFVADLTYEEYKANEQAITGIKTLLHQRIIQTK